MHTLSLLALAATAAATGKGFKDAGSFNCPSTTSNQCNSQQSSGFDFGSAPVGESSWNYGGFNWQGWTCGSSVGKRYDQRRTNDKKHITGVCSSDKNSCPSFGVASGGDVDKFSISTIDVHPEFDCDLEFHYSMPDGSNCKQRSSCSASGSTVKNSQCGGAQNVTVVYPSQANKPKPSCSVTVPSISFSCTSSATSSKIKATSEAKTTTKPAETKPTSEVEKTTSKEIKTSPVLPVETTSVPAITSVPEITPSASIPVVLTSSEEATTSPTQVVSVPISIPFFNSTSSVFVISTPIIPVETTTPVVESSTAPVETTTPILPVESTTPVETNPVVESSTAPVETTTPILPVESLSSIISEVLPTISTALLESTTASVPVLPVESTTAVITTTSIGVSTSTVFSTAIQTITSCAAEITDCPAESQSMVETTVIVAISTTICPVTATQVLTTTFSSPALVATSLPAAITSEASPAGESEAPLPCPSVVPACLNTWLHLTSALDNTDVGAYCPSPDFVSQVYDCMYAYGADDDEVNAAIAYFQGLCAPYAEGNPAVATGAASVTTYLTVTATATATALPVKATYTVVTVSAIGTMAGGQVTTVLTTFSAPQVGFSTAPNGGSVAVVPVKTESIALPVGTGAAKATAPAANAGSSKATGTGAPVSSTTGRVVTAGAGKMYTGAGLVVAAAVAAVLAL